MRWALRLLAKGKHIRTCAIVFALIGMMALVGSYPVLADEVPTQELSELARSYTKKINASKNVGNLLRALNLPRAIQREVFAMLEDHMVIPKEEIPNCKYLRNQIKCGSEEFYLAESGIVISDQTITFSKQRSFVENLGEAIEDLPPNRGMVRLGRHPGFLHWLIPDAFARAKQGRRSPAAVGILILALQDVH